MPALVILPDAEVLVTQFLRQTVEVQARLGDNVFTVLPAGFDGWPACRVVRIGGTTDPLAVLDRPIMQVDVWGGPKLTAQEAAATIRAALSQRLPWTHGTAGTLGGVIRMGTLRDVPDTSFDPARPRYIFDVQLVTRP